MERSVSYRCPLMHITPSKSMKKVLFKALYQRYPNYERITEYQTDTIIWLLEVERNVSCSSTSIIGLA